MGVCFAPGQLCSGPSSEALHLLSSLSVSSVADFSFLEVGGGGVSAGPWE